MPLVPAAWFPHTVQRKRRITGASGVNSKGDPLYDTASNVSARVEVQWERVSTSAGTELRAFHIMALPADAAPRVDDLYWLPAVNGYPADDTALDSAGRTPTAIRTATNKMATQGFHEVRF